MQNPSIKIIFYAEQKLNFFMQRKKIPDSGIAFLFYCALTCILIIKTINEWNEKDGFHSNTCNYSTHQSKSIKSQST